MDVNFFNTKTRNIIYSRCVVVVFVVAVVDVVLNVLTAVLIKIFFGVNFMDVFDQPINKLTYEQIKASTDQQISISTDHCINSSIYQQIIMSKD